MGNDLSDKNYTFNDEKYKSSQQFRKSFYDQLYRLLEEFFYEREENETLRDFFEFMNDEVFESHFIHLKTIERNVPQPKKNKSGFLACPFCAYIGHDNPVLRECEGSPYRAYYECDACGASAPCGNASGKDREKTKDEVHHEAKALWNSRRLYNQAEDDCYLKFREEDFTHRERK